MWRKVGRWGVRIGGGVLAAAVLALAATLIVIHTDWGRGLIRARVEHVLRAALPGGAKIGKIEGSVFSTLIVRDIEIDSIAHRPLAKVGALKISAVIWPLVTRTVRVESIVVEDVHVDPSAGPVVPPTPDEPEPPPSGWTIELPHIELHRAAIELGGPAMSVHDLELAAAVTIAGRDVTAYTSLGGAWGDKQVAALATLASDGHGVRVPAAVMTMDAGGGRARVAMHDVVADPARPRGTVLVSAPAPVIGVWFPVAAQVAALGAPLGDAVVRVKLGGGAADTTTIALTGRAGAAHLDASLQATFARPAVRGLIALTGLDLHALTRGSLAGTGAAVVGLDATLDHARAELAVLPALVARPAPAMIAALDRAAKALASSGSLATIGHELAGPKAPAAPRVFATAELTRRGATWSIVAARAAGTIAGLSASGKPVHGALAFRVQALAPRTPAPLPAVAPAVFVDADVEGSFELAGGGFGELAVASADGQLRGRVTGNDVQVRGELAVDGIANAGKPIGDVRLAIAHRRGQPIDIDLHVRPATAPLTADASLQVTLGDVIRVDLPKLALQMANGTRWDGGGGVATIGDRIALRGLALRHGAAALEIGGQLDPARGDLAAKITAAHIALDALSPKLRGNGGLVVDVARRGGRWRADARLDLTGLAAGKATPPTDASVHVALGGDKLTLDAHASSPDTGALDVAIATAAPRDPTSAAAWRRLDARAIHTLKLTAHQLQIGGLVERASEVELDDEADAPATGTADDVPPSDPIRGTIDGELDLAPTTPGGALAIRGVGLPFGVLDGDVALAPRDGQLAIKIDARMPNVAAAHVGAELAVPAHPFDPATWRDGGRGLLREAEASLDKVRINAAMLDRLGIAQKLAARGLVIPYRASVAVQAHVGAGARDAKLDLDITRVRGGVLVQSLAEHLALTVDDTGTRLHGELRGGGIKRDEDSTLPLGTLDATLAMTMAEWQATPRAAAAAALTARWTLAETDARPVLAIFGRKELTGGTLAIDAEIHGTPIAPIVDHADVTARRLAVAPHLGGHAPPTFDELALSAHLAGGAAAVAITGRESDGGALDGKLDARLDAPDLVAAATGSLTAHRVDLSPIAALLPGRLGAAAGTLDGQLALDAGKVNGALTITGGALPIAPAIGTLRDASAKLTIKDRAVHAELTGGLGGGTINLTADTPPDLASATAKVTLSKVALLGSRRTEISSQIDAKLELGGGQVRGVLALDHTKIHVLQRAGTALLEVDAPADLQLPGGATRTAITGTARVAKPAAPVAAAEPAASSPPVRLHVTLGHTVVWAPEAVQIVPGVDVATAYVNAHSEDGLDVTIGDSVEVVGRVEIDSGDVDFVGRRYLITPVSSAVAFDGSLDPLLLIQMAYAFPAMTLTADVRGRVSAPDPHLSTDVAGYSDDQLFAFFLGGDPGNDLDTSTGTGDAVTAALAKVATSALGRQVNKVLPVKLDSVACAPGTTAASKSCSFGKQLSHGLYLYYSTRPTPLPNENTNEVQLQYRLSNTTLIDVTGGDQGYDTIDILSRHPW